MSPSDEAASATDTLGGEQTITGGLSRLDEQTSDDVLASKFRDACSFVDIAIGSDQAERLLKCTTLSDYTTGRIWMALGDFGRAADDFSAACESGAFQAQATFYTGIIAINQDDLSKAEAQFESSAKKGSQEVLPRNVIRQLKLKDYAPQATYDGAVTVQEAVSYGKKRIDSEREFAHQKSIVEAAQGGEGAAIETIEKTLSIKADTKFTISLGPEIRAERYLFLGHAHFAAGQFEAAIEDFRKAANNCRQYKYMTPSELRGADERRKDFMPGESLEIAAEAIFHRAECEMALGRDSALKEFAWCAGQHVNPWYYRAQYRIWEIEAAKGELDQAVYHAQSAYEGARDYLAAHPKDEEALLFVLKTGCRRLEACEKLSQDREGGVDARTVGKFQDPEAIIPVLQQDSYQVIQSGSQNLEIKHEALEGLLAVADYYLGHEDESFTWINLIGNPVEQVSGRAIADFILEELTRMGEEDLLIGAKIKQDHIEMALNQRNTSEEPPERLEGDIDASLAEMYALIQAAGAQDTELEKALISVTVETLLMLGRDYKLPTPVAVAESDELGNILSSDFNYALVPEVSLGMIHRQEVWGLEGTSTKPEQALVYLHKIESFGDKVPYKLRAEAAHHTACIEAFKFSTILAEHELAKTFLTIEPAEIKEVSDPGIKDDAGKIDLILCRRLRTLIKAVGELEPRALISRKTAPTRENGLKELKFELNPSSHQRVLRRQGLDGRLPKNGVVGDLRELDLRNMPRTLGRVFSQMQNIGISASVLAALDMGEHAIGTEALTEEEAQKRRAFLVYAIHYCVSAIFEVPAEGSTSQNRQIRVLNFLEQQSGDGLKGGIEKARGLSDQYRTVLERFGLAEGYGLAHSRFEAGLFYAEQDDPDAAAEHFLACLQESGLAAISLYNLGACTRDRNFSIDYFQKALRHPEATLEIKVQSILQIMEVYLNRMDRARNTQNTDTAKAMKGFASQVQKLETLTRQFPAEEVPDSLREAACLGLYYRGLHAQWRGARLEFDPHNNGAMRTDEQMQADTDQALGYYSQALVMASALGNDDLQEGIRNKMVQIVAPSQNAARMSADTISHFENRSGQTMAHILEQLSRVERGDVSDGSVLSEILEVEPFAGHPYKLMILFEGVGINEPRSILLIEDLLALVEEMPSSQDVVYLIQVIWEELKRLKQEIADATSVESVALRIGEGRVVKELKIAGPFAETQVLDRMTVGSLDETIVLPNPEERD
ncbi:MAG TPA: tetratricopeptide repeat protein [Candidatus Gracilibacteria bacterium]